jgi:ribonuclease BN (tRNA processing enzyme)
VNLLTLNGTQYPFNAGNGVARQPALAHVPVGTIGRIFITHIHDDHNADSGTPIGLVWSLGRAEQKAASAMIRRRPNEITDPLKTEHGVANVDASPATDAKPRPAHGG